MERRDALKRLAMASVAAASTPAWGSAQTDDAWAPRVLTPHQNESVVALTELIIPQTDTAGAKAARVNVFIDTVLADADEGARDAFVTGLEWTDARSRELFGASFIDAGENEQTALLTIVSSEDNDTSSDRVGVDFFQTLKQLTVTGYYSSEIGMLEELGDDGGVYFDDDPGCQHPEHQRGGAQ